MASSRYYVRIGGAVGDVGEIKYGFVSPENAYEGIADELGVKEIAQNEDAKGIVFGANYPKPPKVRINFSFTEGTQEKRGSATRFCDTDKLGQVLNGALNDKTITVRGRSCKIESVSIPG